MINNEPQIDEFKTLIENLYQSGNTENQEKLLEEYGKNPQRFEFLQRILDNPELSSNLTHFALVSLRSLFEMIFNQKDEDFFSTFQSWLFRQLFEHGPNLEKICLDAFCQLYGTFFGCLFRKVDSLVLTTDDINSFFASENPIYKVIGFNLCMNVINSMKKVLKMIPNSNEQTYFVKETTLLTCFTISINSMMSESYFNNLDIMISIFDLFLSCLKFDEDITQKITKIYFPETQNWVDTLHLFPTLFNCIAEFFNNHSIGSIQAQKLALDALSYLIIVRLDHSIYIDCLNILLPLLINILHQNPLETDNEIISNIIDIIVQTSKIILVSDIELIPSYENYVTAVNEFTIEFSNLNVCIPQFDQFMTLLEFWSNLKISNPFSQPLNGLLYDVIHQLASAKFNLIDEFGFDQASSFMSLFWKIGQMNYCENAQEETTHSDEQDQPINNLLAKQYPKESNILRKILMSFDSIQNELYDLYNSPLKSQEINDPVMNRIEELELLAVYHALIIASPIIRNVAVENKSFMDYSMISLLCFLIQSLDRITVLRPAITEILQNDKFELMRIENLVVFLISQLEKDSCPLAKSFTSPVMFYFDCYFIQKKKKNVISDLRNLHVFFLRRLLFIPKTYPTDSPIVRHVFETIISFYCIDSDENVIIDLCKELFNGFLYRMRLRPGQRLNNFYGRNWELRAHYDFHRLFSFFFSSASRQPEFASIKSEFIYFLKDLKLRISNLINLHTKINQAQETNSSIIDLTRLDIKANNEVEMSSNLFNLLGLNFSVIKSEETQSYLIELPDLSIKSKIIEMMTSHLIDLVGLLKNIDNSVVYGIFYDKFFDFIPHFRHFNLDPHFFLRFLYEFSEDRNERITKFVQSQSNQISDADLSKGKEKTLLFKSSHQYEFQSLIFFKEAGMAIIDYFTSFKTDPMKYFDLLKYAYRIISNLFSQFSLSIGAFKMYNDKEMYDRLLLEYLDNLTLLDLQFNVQLFCNLKLTKAILNSVIVFGSKDSLFSDIFDKRPTYFKTSLFIVAKLLNEINQMPNIIDNNDQWEDVFDVIYHTIYVMAAFFISRRNTTIGPVLFDKQSIEYFQLLLDGLLQVILKNPQFYNCNFLKVMNIIEKLNPDLFGEGQQNLFHRIHGMFSEPSDE